MSNGISITLVYPTEAVAQAVTYSAFTVQIASNSAPIACLFNGGIGQTGAHRHVALHRWQRSA